MHATEEMHLGGDPVHHHAGPRARDLQECTIKKCNQNSIDLRGMKIHKRILKIIARA